jgi:hypothetical protein
MYGGKKPLKIRATSVILKKKMPKVNTRPVGENSPKLVTLLSLPKDTFLESTRLHVSRIKA